jgi:hypothetical protein
MAKKQITNYKFVPGYKPTDAGLYPNAVTVLTANKDYLIEETVAYLTFASNTPGTAPTAYPNAEARLTNNRAFIIEEASAWIEDQIANAAEGEDFFEYDYNATIEAKCRRDIGYILDAILVDVQGGGNADTIRIARTYYRNGVAQLLSPAEESATYTFIKSLVNTYVMTSSTYTPLQVIEAIDQTGSTGEAAAVTKVNDLFDIVIDIIQNGLGGIPAISYNYNADFVGYTYNETKCRRDTEYVIDSFIYDLQYGGNSLTWYVSSRYWINGIPQVDGSRDQEVIVHEHLRDVITDYVLTKTLYPSYNTTDAQSVPGITIENGASTKVDTLNAILVDTIANGLSSLPRNDAPDGTSNNLAPNTVQLIEANKRYIAEEAAAYIAYNTENNIAPFTYFTYNDAKCRRDVSYILEGYISDLRSGGNRQTVHNASKYWENGVAAVDGSREPEISTHTFIRDLIDNYILNNVAFTSRQTLLNQTILGGVTPDPFGKTRLKELSNTILDVIEYGLDYLPETVSNRGSIKIPGFFKQKDFLLVTNVSRNEIIYNFADTTTSAEVTYSEFDDEDFQAFKATADQVTTLTFDNDTSDHMVTDNIQIFVEGKEQVVHMNNSASDAMERIKMAKPQAMLDADFEYGLQPTKWQAISTVRSYPSVYEIPGSEISVLSVVTDASSGTSGVGASLITVTTNGPHGLEIGDAITIKALENTVSGFSRAEGSFLIVDVPTTTTLQYYSKSKVGTSDGEVLATTYTQLREAAFYTGADIGTPTFSVVSNGVSGSLTVSLDVLSGVDFIGFSGTTPPVGAPLNTTTGIASGTQISSVIGTGGIEATTKLTSTAEIGDSTVTVEDTTGIQVGLAFDRGDGVAVRVTSVSGSDIGLSGNLTSRILGTTESYTGSTGTTSGSGTGAVFTVSRNASSYSAVVTSPGTRYVAGDTITILGSTLDGVDSTNDATLTVTAASNLDTVSTFDSNTLYSGTGYVQTTALSTTSNGSGTGLLVDITIDGSGAIQTVTVNDAGQGYSVGETINITQGLPTALGLNSGGTGYTSGTKTTTASTGSGTGLTVLVEANQLGGAGDFTLTNAGDGYTSATGVSPTGGTGAGLTIDYTATSVGGVNGITLSNAGSGYTTGGFGTVNITGTGTGLEVEIFVTGGVTGTNIEFAGSTYSDATGVTTTTTGQGTGLTLDITTTAGAVTGVTVNAAGSGYAVSDSVVLDGGDGSAIVSVTSISGGGAITSIEVSSTQPGTGYAVNDTFYVNDPSSNLDSVITISSVTNGEIDNISIVSSGSGYTATDVLTIPGSSGTSATLTLDTVTNQEITAVEIVNGGTGYNSGDIITIDGGSTLAQIEVLTIEGEAQIQVASVNDGGLIQSLSAAGTVVTSPDENFIAAINLNTTTTAGINSSTTLSYSAIATIGVSFDSPHGLIPGNSITTNITSEGTNHDLAGGPFYIESVPTATTIRYTARTAGTVSTAESLTGTVYPRPDSYYVHRPFDGGVQLGTGGPQHGVGAVRMSKKYIRYQSGKGVMYNTGALFAPSYDLRSLEATGTTVGSTITVTTDDTDHGTQVGCGITITGVNTSGYNGQYTVTDIVTERVFKIQAIKTLGDTVAELGDDCKMSVRAWHGSTVRAGAYDDQNGIFWQYDGRRLAVVKRSSTFQVAGVCSIQTNKNTVTGSNTRFTDQLIAGDKIVIRGMTHTVASIQSDTSMTVTPDFRGVVNVTDVKVAKVVDEIVPQEWWNLDSCNGSGSSGYNIDITKMQMIGLQYTWYGAGFIDWMLRGSDGNYVWAHRDRNSNVNTEAFMRTGNLPVRYEVINEGARGRLAADMDGTQDYIELEDTYWFPDSGTVYIDNELITYTGRTTSRLTGCTRESNLTQFTSGSNRTYTAGGATTHTRKTGAVLVSNTCTPIISHWGSAFLIDGEFDDDRGYIFSYSETNIEVSTTKQTAFMIRLAPSVSNAITGDLGERELLNRAQLLLQGIEITSDVVDTGGTNTATGGIVVEGILNPQNYPVAPSNVGWSGLTSTAQGGQPSFAQIAGSGSINWDTGGTATTADITAQAAMSTTAITNDGSSRRSNFIYMRWDGASGMDGKNIRAGDTVTGTNIRSGTTITSISSPYAFGGNQEVTVYLSQRPSNNISQGATITFSRGGDLNARNFGYFTKTSVETAGISAGTEVNATGSSVTFPANTLVNNLKLDSLGTTEYYEITFNNSYNGTLTAGSGTVQVIFQQPPYAQPGETVFSFIAAPGERSELVLDQLKELTNTTVGGRGTFPNGPDVLAINIYKATGTSVNANVILRWGEAQA